MEPPHSYVHETSASVVHHADYLNGSADHALCGLAFENPARVDPTIHPTSVCGDCEARLVEYHLKWWREAAEAATAELDELRIKYRKLSRAIEEPNRQVSASGPQAGPAAEQAETPPTGLLDQARKEIVELCGQFDAAVPYWRVKNCMDAFSDKLKSDERVLLAQEIGAAGSLIRWCTREIENLGWRVTNNPVHDDADTMMDAWTEDYYQTPQKSRWRRGRSR